MAKRSLFWRGRARLRQAYADLLAQFWLRPGAMTLAAVLLAETLVWSEGSLPLPDGLSGWVYAGGLEGARKLLGAIAAAEIGVASTTFSITVAAMTMASNQMGPRLLRNFTRDPGNQYALGAFLASFAYALAVLRTVRDQDDAGAFVPHLAVTVGMVLAFGCVGVLMWFIHHVANSINVSHVVVLVHRELAGAIAALPPRDARAAEPLPDAAFDAAAPLRARSGGYLRALDDEALADWADEHRALLRLRVRPGDFVFPATTIGEVVPPAQRDAAEAVLAKAMSLGRSRSVEQDIEYAARQLVEIALRALSPSLNDPFTAIGVLDHFGEALCDLANHSMRPQTLPADGPPRYVRPQTDYEGLVDLMFHMIRQSATESPAVLIRLAEVLAAVADVETDPARRRILARHAALLEEAGAALPEADAARTLDGRLRRLRERLAG